jgi:hypothetical protein
LAGRATDFAGGGEARLAGFAAGLGIVLMAAFCVAVALGTGLAGDLAASGLADFAATDCPPAGRFFACVPDLAAVAFAGDGRRPPERSVDGAEPFIA